MPSKQTDYVNAQFEDAQAKIEELFKEIGKQDTEAGEYPIAVNHVNMSWGWFGWSHIEVLLIWRAKGRIHMVCMVCAWKRNTGSGSGYEIDIKPWGIPRKTYSKTLPGGTYVEMRPTENGVYLSLGVSGEPWEAPIIFQDSWSV